MADQIYKVPKQCRDVAYIKSFDEYKKMHTESIENPDKFWGDMARELLDWHHPFNKVMSGSLLAGDHTWFLEGKINVCYNCVDRHLPAKAKDVALIWEGDKPDEIRHITYLELFQKVCQCANMLKSFGLRKGDTVAFYMPNSPEIVYAMLACARLGIMHSIVFAGFSAEALAQRIIDAKSKMVFTFDEGTRGGRVLPLKTIVDEAIKKCDSVEAVIVYKFSGNPDIPMKEGFDYDFDTELKKQKPYCPCVPLDANDPLFLLYTSGSTGKPKGICHTQAGYILHTAMTMKYVFDYHPGDIFACVADVGWITGHSYIVYGPLAVGATTFLFSGTPLYPNASRYWDMVQRHKITTFYTAPTAIRALMKYGTEPLKGYDLSTLRILGTVGEPINPEAWLWYYNEVGKKNCSIVDTYWQTESGGHILAPLPGAIDLKPGSGTFPVFGVDFKILDSQSGEEIKGACSGLLAISRQWPGLASTIFNDHQRFLETYMTPYPGYYFTGDGAKRDEDGYIFISGRVDDVINVSGHRMGTAEVESALVASPFCAEAAVVGFPHDVKGQGICAYCILRVGFEDKKEVDVVAALKQAVRKDIGALATPDFIVITPSLPKTRSGKIMRRILRKIAANETDQLGDISTLAEPQVVEELINKFNSLRK